MKMNYIFTKEAPEAIGAYNQAVVAGNFVYTSGQIALNADGVSSIGKGLKQETLQVMQNLKAILNASGSGFHKVVKSTIYLTDMSNFPELNQVYESFFEEGLCPARETVEVGALPKEAQIEISMVAIVD